MFTLVIVFFIGGTKSETIKAYGKFKTEKECLVAAHDMAYQQDVINTYCIKGKK